MKPCLYKIARDFSRSTENVSADEWKGRFSQVNCLIQIILTQDPIIVYSMYMELLSRTALLLVTLQAVSSLPEPEAGLNVNHLPLLSR